MKAALRMLRSGELTVNHLDTPIIYNLFPRLVGPHLRWLEHAERAVGMGFNWIYLNPIHYPGFSGSLYAVKQYDGLHPMFAAGESEDLQAIAPTLKRMSEIGAHPIVDLVINHTAKDSPLVEEHPAWYVRDAHGHVESPYAIDPGDPSNVTVWGDLAEIDNAGSPEREQLWDFWASLVRRYLDLGFEGFRCDAAYKVPSELWRYLVETARERNPQARFFAETLGCTLEQARALKDSGLDFFFNSSKWWDFQAPWCIEQHEEFHDIPSVSFPESHDTERLAAESGGSEAVQRQRYAFAALFSAGLMMPIGYEYGFRRKLDVVRTEPSDWERPLFDITTLVSRVNAFKLATPLAQGEGRLQRVPSPSPSLTVLERSSERAEGSRGWILVNTSVAEGIGLPRTALAGGEGSLRLARLSRDDLVQEGEPAPEWLHLDPAEVVLLWW